VAAVGPDRPADARLTVTVAHAELFGVGYEHALVMFTSDPGEGAVTRCADVEIETVGPRHVVRVGGLEPDTEYALRVDGVEPDAALPARFRTLARPSGRLLATIATANDVHFGETECGHLGPPHEDIGPFFHSAPGEPPYPEVMNGAVIDEMRLLDPDVVVVKGDLTERGTEEQFAAFLSAYGVFGDRLSFVRGNHDAMADPTMAVEGAPYGVEVGGITLAVLDTVIPGRAGGHVPPDQIQWLDDLASETTGPILVFGHHDVWPIDAPVRPDDYFGLTPDSSDDLVALVARRENVAGYFAGHTHGNRVYRFASARHVPFVEVACTKDYPGAWAEYRVFEGGYTQEVHRVTAPDAFDWAEATRGMFLGVYGELARGELVARCFTERF
jgi:predicted phosphodiesterase